MEQFLKEELDLRYFHENNYIRKKCASCGSYFWTLDANAVYCGDQPCVKFSFIGNPLGKKTFSLRDVRESFLSFFERNNHQRLHFPVTGERMPIVARWRSDIYLTIASIADFQPHVTSGEVPPPANPLVISQPCIRLNDLEQVGKSGRHLTMFEMMGHHAFNKNTDEIYWKEETVQYCDEFFVNIIGIPKEKLTYKEQLWYGGGNAGPCLEVLAGGLEIATLVFMNMKEDPHGEFIINEETYTGNPLNIVDTGYGLERIAWVTQGTETVYDTVFPEIINWIKNHAKNLSNMTAIYSLADHSKSLAFMLGDGIVPSNAKAGYLARLLIRRSLRFIEEIKFDGTLKEIVGVQLNSLKEDFPSLLKQKKQIDEMLDLETERYHDTLAKGEQLVKRMLHEKTNISEEELIRLYDTHGMPPSVVQTIAQREGVTIEIPENFESKVASLHNQEITVAQTVKKRENLPSTIPLYYTDHYMKEFDATVVWVHSTPKGTEVILDQTAFYPEGGGQPSDTGVFITSTGEKRIVHHVSKEGNSIIHLIDGPVDVSDRLHGKIDWNRRYSIMKHHTGTHVVNGALRMVLGEHVWQAGSQLDVINARFDYAHYKSLSEEEQKNVEEAANEFIRQNISVKKKVMGRNDAEREHGFRLYQGGVPPGNKIRVIEIPGVDVEACGGTHLDNIGEIEKIRILKTERIQDGVNRIIFAAGEMVELYQQEEQQLYYKLLETLASTYEIKTHDDVSRQLKNSAAVFSVPIDQLNKTLKRFLKETNLQEKTVVETLEDACQHLFTRWKKTKKQEKKVSTEVLEELKKSAELIPGTSIKLIIAKISTEGVATAGAIITDPDYIVHLYDGRKITSGASENIDIDFREEIAPEIGKVLGGSGGGKPRLTQSGGPEQKNIDAALEKARELTIKAFQQ